MKALILYFTVCWLSTMWGSKDVMENKGTNPLCVYHEVWGNGVTVSKGRNSQEEPVKTQNAYKVNCRSNRPKIWLCYEKANNSNSDSFCYKAVFFLFPSRKPKGGQFTMTSWYGKSPRAVFDHISVRKTGVRGRMSVGEGELMVPVFRGCRGAALWCSVSWASFWNWGCIQPRCSHGTAPRPGFSLFPQYCTASS